MPTFVLIYVKLYLTSDMIPKNVENFQVSIIMCGMKLLIHS